MAMKAFKLYEPTICSELRSDIVANTKKPQIHRKSEGASL